jgi:hypothetical protein
MKNLLFAAVALLAFAGCSEPKINLRAATYNVRYDAAADAEN